MPAIATIDAYIAAAPEAARAALKAMRRILRAAVPAAEEALSYHMPTFRLDGKDLLHFAACKDHLGFYGFGEPPAAWKDRISGRGTARFAYGEALPAKEIAKVAKAKAAALRAKAKPKPKPKPGKAARKAKPSRAAR